jgi:hypothetical protein
VKPLSHAPRATLPLLVAALSSCAPVVPGITTSSPYSTDQTAVRAPPSGWERIAVVPFGGAAAHRRPAEELVAVKLAAAVPLALVPPFRVERACRLRDDVSVAPAAVERWVQAALGAEGQAVPRDELRALAAALAADALVLGRVEPGGAFADVVLVEGASGEPVAAVRRAGSPWAAQRGVHELAMSSTARALADLVEVLLTAPGKEPRVRREPEPAFMEEHEPGERP